TEALEDQLLVVDGKSNTVIADAGNRRSDVSLHRDLDGFAGAELESVGEDVRERLLQATTIPGSEYRWSRPILHRTLRRLGHRRQGAQHMFHYLTEVNSLRVEVPGPGRQLGRVERFPDQLAE